MTTYLPGVAKATVVYDAASNCLTSAYIQRNNYYILQLYKTLATQNIITVMLHHFQMQKNRLDFEICHVVYICHSKSYTFIYIIIWKQVSCLLCWETTATLG